MAATATTSRRNMGASFGRIRAGIRAIISSSEAAEKLRPLPHQICANGNGGPLPERRRARSRDGCKPKGFGPKLVAAFSRPMIVNRARDHHLVGAGRLDQRSEPVEQAVRGAD